MAPLLDCEPVTATRFSFVRDAEDDCYDKQLADPLSECRVLDYNPLDGTDVGIEFDPSFTCTYRIKTSYAINGLNNLQLTGQTVTSCSTACCDMTAFTCRSYDYNVDGRCNLSDEDTRTVPRCTATVTTNCHEAYPTGWFLYERAPAVNTWAVTCSPRPPSSPPTLPPSSPLPLPPP